MNRLLLIIVASVTTVILALALGLSSSSRSLERPISSEGFSFFQYKASGSWLGSSNQKLVAPNAWHGLVPLHSMRADVERLLGKPQLSHGLTSIYKTKDERVHVIYSLGYCELSGVERWKVPQDVVIRIMVSPNRNILLQELNLDRKKYTRRQRTHPENWIDYVSRDDGIVFRAVVVGEREEIDLITYGPSAQDEELYCQDPGRH
jgi:hypothetical protein